VEVVVAAPRGEGSLNWLPKEGEEPAVAPRGEGKVEGVTEEATEKSAV